AEPRGILAALENNRLYEAIYLETTRGGRKQPPIQMVPAWEPLLTLFVDERGEWALWTPQGFYDSSVAEGDELFGWQINRGAGVTPRLLKAAGLQRQFDRPDLIRNLLSAGNVPDAFRAAGEAPPADFESYASAVVQSLPEARVVRPLFSDRFELAAECRVVAHVDFSASAPRARFVVSGFVNGRPLGPPRKESFDANSGRLTLEWSSVPPDPLSRFQVKVEERSSDGRGRLNYDAHEVAVRAQVPPPQYRLHVLVLAAGEYTGGSFAAFPKSADGAFPSINDANALLESLRRSEGIHFELASVWPLLEQQTRRANVERTISEIVARLSDAEPRDLLVVFLSGHGYAHGPDYYFIPPHVASSQAETLQREAVSWSMLDRLTSLPCRKVIFLDTCHAGNALLNEENRAEQVKA
ncbi:MAG: caspase family protein, partial [Planctomycetaceae bacterium]